MTLTGGQKQKTKKKTLNHLQLPCTSINIIMPLYNAKISILPCRELWKLYFN